MRKPLYIQPDVVDRTLTASERTDSYVLPPRLVPRGTRIADYEIVELLGEGGSAVVYRARDRRRGREVAAKLLHPNLLGNTPLRSRFRREAELMTSWRHPHVVEVFDFVEDDSVSMSVMELVDGPTLEDHLDLGGAVELDELCPLFAPILAAMNAAHGHGIVHRDLKPRNVLIAAGPTPKVSDFGIAKLVDGPTFTQEGALLGSCRYMAPEQARSAAAVDHRADIYSLGVMLYRAVTGRLPFDGDHPLQLIMAHVNQPAPPARDLRPDLPPALDALIAATLAKNPGERPSSCNELATAMCHALSHQRAA